MNEKTGQKRKKRGERKKDTPEFKENILLGVRLDEDLVIRGVVVVEILEVGETIEREEAEVLNFRPTVLAVSFSVKVK